MLKERPELELEIKTIEELKGVVHKVLDLLQKRNILAFYGEIGAGKTSLIQAICQQLGVKEPVTSPTFSLINEYSFLDNTGKPQPVYHMDLYRLEQIEEALEIGIEEYLEAPNYCLIEWPEIIEDLLPEDSMRINIQIIDDSTRKILIL